MYTNTCGYYTVVFDEEAAQRARLLTQSIIEQSRYSICVVVNNPSYLGYLPVHERIRPLVFDWPENGRMCAITSADLYTPWQRTFLIEPDWILNNGSEADACFDSLDTYTLGIQPWKTVNKGHGFRDRYAKLITALQIKDCHSLQLYHPWLLFDSKKDITTHFFSTWRMCMFIASALRLRTWEDVRLSLIFAIKQVICLQNIVLLKHIYNKNSQKYLFNANISISSQNNADVVKEVAAPHFELNDALQAIATTQAAKDKLTDMQIQQLSKAV